MSSVFSSTAGEMCTGDPGCSRFGSEASVELDVNRDARSRPRVGRGCCCRSRPRCRRADTPPCVVARLLRHDELARRPPSRPVPGHPSGFGKNKEPGRAPAALRWLRRGGWAAQERPCRVRSHTGRRPIDLTSSASAFSSSTETLTRLLAKALSGRPWTISHSPL